MGRAFRRSSGPTTRRLPAPVVPGNLDPFNRPVLKNTDGTVSTASTISIGTDKGEVLIPTVVNGVRLTEQEAIGVYQKTGKHFGIFSSVGAADQYAEWLHNEMARKLEQKK